MPEHLMYGSNYMVELGIAVWENCHSIPDFKGALKKKYPLTKPEAVSLIETSERAFWEEIDYCFSYRGDETAGLMLDAIQETQLASLQESYRAAIKQFMTAKTKIYSYPDETGIPGCPPGGDIGFCF